MQSETSEWRVPPEVSELRVAVIGAGKMARLHLQTLKAMPGVRLAAICNRSSDTGHELAREFGIESVYNNVARMLGETSPDAAFIAVSHAATSQVASEVLDAKVPCLVEKPAGYSAEEVAHLVSLAASAGVVNLVGVNRRYYGSINQALLAVSQQGAVRGILVEAHEPILEYRSRGQLDTWIYDKWMVANTIHAIDLLRMVGGDVAEIKVFAKSIDELGADSFSAAIQFENGMLGNFVAHSNSTRRFGLKIYGEGVAAELYPLERGFVSYDTGSSVKLRPDWTDTRFKPGLYAQNSAFLQAVADKEPAPYPASDLKDHEKTLRLIEQMQAETPVGAERRPGRSVSDTNQWQTDGIGETAGAGR